MKLFPETYCRYFLPRCSQENQAANWICKYVLLIKANIRSQTRTSVPNKSASDKCISKNLSSHTCWLLETFYPLEFNFCCKGAEHTLGCSWEYSWARSGQLKWLQRQRQRRQCHSDCSQSLPFSRKMWIKVLSWPHLLTPRGTVRGGAGSCSVCCIAPQDLFVQRKTLKKNYSLSSPGGHVFGGDVWL